MTVTADKTVEKKFMKAATDPVFMAALCESYGHRQDFESRIVDSVTQRFRDHGEPSLKEWYAFSNIWAHLLMGELYVTRVHVGAHPVQDSRKDENNGMLQGLPRPFTASFWGGNQPGSDGVIEWDEEIDAEELGVGGNTTRKIPPGGAPLEAGYFSAARFWVDYIVRGLSLARWPYGHDEILIFTATTKLLDRYFGGMNDAFRKTGFIQ